MEETPADHPEQRGRSPEHRPDLVFPARPRLRGNLHPHPTPLSNLSREPCLGQIGSIEESTEQLLGGLDRALPKAHSILFVLSLGTTLPGRKFSVPDRHLQVWAGWPLPFALC